MNESDELEKLKHAASADGVEDLLLRRWSPRAFSDKKVSPADLKTVFDAARWAASSFNEQPWRFLVGMDGDPTHVKIFDTLVAMNQAWAKAAPVLILSVGKKTFTKAGNPNHYALHDTGAATANLTLQATALGLHAHSMGGFDREKARQSFAIPDDFEIGAVTALGYLGDPSTLSEQQQQMEKAPRARNPFSAFVFSEWDTPASL